MRRYDTEYEAYRREQIWRLSNMDPDILVAELDISTETILNALWEHVENYIEENYDGSEEKDDYDTTD